MKALITFLLLSLYSANSFAINATHGMVLFGREKLMAYHLPMFHKIHAKQVVLEYTLPEEIKNTMLSQVGENNFLTFVPKPFDLEEFLKNPNDLTGDIYLGHFEKDGVVIISNVTLENVKVLFAQDLVKGQPLNQESYRFFGTPNDVYGIHLINNGQAMDQITKVTENPARFKARTWTHIGLLEKGENLMTSEDPCPTRCWLGSGIEDMKINVEQIYFSDSVM